MIINNLEITLIIFSSSRATFSCNIKKCGKRLYLEFVMKYIEWSKYCINLEETEIFLVLCEMDFSSDHYYKLNRIFLSAIGLWPHRYIILRQTQGIISSFILISVTIPQVCDNHVSVDQHLVNCVFISVNLIEFISNCYENNVDLYREVKSIKMLLFNHFVKLFFKRVRYIYK